MDLYSFLEDYDRSPKVSGAAVAPAADLHTHPVVTIETTDDFRVTADLTSLHICMRKTSDISQTSE